MFTLADAYPEGNTEIWYAKEGFTRDSMMGVDWLRERDLLPTTMEKLQKNWVKLGTIQESNPERIFYAMQGEMWSPNGEAREFIQASGSGHTSMSVGDILVRRAIGGAWVMMVDRFGFKRVATLKELV